MAAARGIPVRGVSAGTEPREDLNPVVKEAMAEIGISMQGQRPKPLTQKLADQADRIITMGRGVDVAPCLERPEDVEDWGLNDPMGKTIEGVRQVRDQVKQRVETLLEEMNG
jgi:arsenate reductase